MGLGVPAESLAARMTEREFVAWQRYAARKMLPQRRIEVYLAQIAMLIAKTMGGHTDARLDDYLFDPADTDPVQQLDDEDLVAEAREFFDFAPMNG